MSARTARPQAASGHPEATELTPEEAQRWVRVGMLAALAIVLGYLETFVPIPIPGVKLGLANIAILIALAQHDASGAFGIAVIKVLASGLLFGSPVMMAYSATGTLFAFAMMAPLSRLRTMHIAMTSVVGAMAHEMGQLLVAMLFLGTPLVWYSAPVLLLAGCVTGALCGLVAARTVAFIQSEVTSTEGTTPSVADSTSPAPLPMRGPKPGVPHVHPKVALLCFVAFCVFVLHASSLALLGAALVGAAVACAVGRVRVRDLKLALRPLVFILLVTLVAQVLSTQQGAVVAVIGPVTLTSEALNTTAAMMCRLLALTAASLALMHLVSLEGLMDALEWVITPLRMAGLRTEGFMLALRSALEFVPLLATTIAENATTLKGELGSRKLWSATIPRIIAQLYQGASKEDTPHCLM